MIPPFVDAAWLDARTDDVVVADVRWYLDGRSGLAAYEGGHLPGAVFVDLDRWLAGAPGPDVGRHPLPDPDVFALGMSALGITDGSTVIAYDDAGGTVAARLVWLLRAVGVDAALLDGGVRGYGGALETVVTQPVRASFTPRAWPAERLAMLDELTDPGRTVLDARDGARYRGEVEPVDPRAGHVPGAMSLPCRENLDADGLLLPVSQLRRRLADAGVSEGSDVISYCGSGVTACHTLLVLEHAGLRPGRLSPGSWSQWSNDPHRPVATGATP